MPDPILYLKAMAVAAGASATFVLALGWARRPASTARLTSASILGIGLGLALGFYVLRLRLHWPPANGLDRLLTIVFPAVIAIEWVAGFERVPQWLAWFLRFGLAAAIGKTLLHGSVYLGGPGRDWTPAQAFVLLTLSSALLLAVWALLAWLSRRSPGVSIPLVLALAIQCAGIAIMLAGYVTGGAAALPPVAAVVGAAVASSLNIKRTPAQGTTAAQGTIGIGVVALFGLLFIGRFFGGLSTAQALTIFLTPLVCWATEIPALRSRNPWLVGALRLLLAAIPLAIVLTAAKRNFDRDTAPLLGTETETALPAEPAISVRAKLRAIRMTVEKILTPQAEPRK